VANVVTAAPGRTVGVGLPTEAAEVDGLAAAGPDTGRGDFVGAGRAARAGVVAEVAGVLAVDELGAGSALAGTQPETARVMTSGPRTAGQAKSGRWIMSQGKHFRVGWVHRRRRVAVGGHDPREP
jgi:hypothetical protein